MLDQCAALGGVYEELHQHDLDEPMGFLGSSCFDLITCFGVTEMLRSVDSVLLAEVARLLRPKGQCWMSFQYNNGSNTASHQGMINWRMDEIVSSLRKNNLEVISSEVMEEAYLLPNLEGMIHPVPFCLVKVCKK
eukprot:TRINITY_DN18713_c0_g1_i1.p1 TRINITY_DN18713_c0_g1~~TRINITY_DN18713_c0_g1_i1.p1  ORF type:complete len:143 (-),score=33.32 TRINITY_DN18713_c0_g1_i1:3-407(-)